jgi:hypothetical protein
MSQKLKTTPKASPKNTLFNYFAKNTPKTEEKDGKTGNTEVKEEKPKELKELKGKQLDFGKN